MMLKASAVRHADRAQMSNEVMVAVYTSKFARLGVVQIDMIGSRPFRAVYWSKGPVALYSGPLSVGYGAQSGGVALDGGIRMTWDPSPRVGWTGSTDDSATTVEIFDHAQSSTTWPQISLVGAMGVPMVPPRRGSRVVVEPPGRATDSGPCEGLTFGQPDASLDRLVFNVINGPEVLGRGVLRDRSSMWLGRWTLESAAWRVSLDNRPNLDSQISALTRSRRHAFTHVGVLERADGVTFTATEAEQGLEEVFLFLTFVRGATVGIALPTGFLGSERVWTRWTSGLSAPYTGHFGWADPHRAEDIAALWPLFLTHRADARWSLALLRSIRYYAEAVPMRSAETAVIVGQAALELLAAAVLVDRDGRFESAKWDSKPAPWRLRKLLQAASIPLAVPANAIALQQAVDLHGWHDVADAMAAIRNTATHWSTGKPDLDIEVWIDIQKVVLASLELSILWALGYTGDTLRRTDGPVIRGASVPVPWSTHAELG